MKKTRSQQEGGRNGWGLGGGLGSEFEEQECKEFFKSAKIKEESIRGRRTEQSKSQQRI